MREIKFRIWDNVDNKYRYLGSEHDVFEIARDGSISYLNYQSGAGGAEVILEQFTGLHDKNGKEIYEGDVLQGADHLGSIAVIQFALGHFGVNWDYVKNQDPEWSKGTVYGGWGTRTNLRRIDDGFLDNFIVVGNIHENPELLEGGE